MKQKVFCNERSASLYKILVRHSNVVLKIPTHYISYKSTYRNVRSLVHAVACPAYPQDWPYFSMKPPSSRLFIFPRSQRRAPKCPKCVKVHESTRSWWMPKTLRHAILQSLPINNPSGPSLVTYPRLHGHVSVSFLCWGCRNDRSSGGQGTSGNRRHENEIKDHNVENCSRHLEKETKEIYVIWMWESNMKGFMHGKKRGGFK